MRVAGTAGGPVGIPPNLIAPGVILTGLHGFGDNMDMYFTTVSYISLTLSGLRKICSKLIKYPPILSLKPFNKICI